MILTAAGHAIIEGDNYLSAEIEREGRLDVASARNLLEPLRQYIPVGGVVVDVGASLGDTAAVMSGMVGDRGNVVAFEPYLSSYECLRHNLIRFTRVTCFNHALGDTPNVSVRMVVDSNNVGASRLEIVETAQDPVIVDTLDMVSRLWRGCDFIKIDAEGWEPLILDGAVETIRRFRPAMLIEVNDWPLGKMGFTRRDIYSRLDALGYSWQDFDGPYGDVLCAAKEKT